jgi:dephospho-CoA kinase
MHSPVASTSRPLLLGLTGGIGSGKSTVSRRLAELGAVVIDADAIARSVTAPGGLAMPAIQAQFGDAFVAPDGALDRDRMRQHVFSHPQAKRQLEAIVHPLVGEETARQTRAALALNPPVIVFDVPLLVESAHWRERVDRILVVDCLPATQIERVVARSRLAPADVERIIAAQATREQRRAIADWVLLNEGVTLAQLHQQIDALMNEFRSVRQQLAGAPLPYPPSGV